MHALKKSKQHRYLEAPNADHFGGEISVGRMKARFDVEAVLFAGPIMLNEKESKDYYQALAAAIERTMQMYQRAVPLSDKKWYCLDTSNHQDGFFFFNSHGVKPMNEHQANSKARYFWCQDVDKLAKIIVNGLKSGSSAYYQLHGVLVEQIETEDKSERCLKRKLEMSNQIIKTYRRAVLLSDEEWYCFATSNHQDGFFFINSHGIGRNHRERAQFWKHLLHGVLVE